MYFEDLNKSSSPFLGSDLSSSCPTVSVLLFCSFFVCTNVVFDLGTNFLQYMALKNVSHYFRMTLANFEAGLLDGIVGGL